MNAFARGLKLRLGLIRLSAWRVLIGVMCRTNGESSGQWGIACMNRPYRTKGCWRGSLATSSYQLRWTVAPVKTTCRNSIARYRCSDKSAFEPRTLRGLGEKRARSELAEGVYR